MVSVLTRTPISVACFDGSNSASDSLEYQTVPIRETLPPRCLHVLRVTSIDVDVETDGTLRPQPAQSHSLAKHFIQSVFVTISRRFDLWLKHFQSLPCIRVSQGGSRGHPSTSVRMQGAKTKSRRGTKTHADIS